MSASTPAGPSQPQPSAGSRPVLFLLIALCAFFLFTYALRLSERDRVEQEIAQQEIANQQALAREAALKKELAVASKSSYVEILARGILQMGKPNETVIIPVGEVADGAATIQVEAVVPITSLPIWRQWLELIAPRG